MDYMDPMSSVLKKADELNLSLSLMLSSNDPCIFSALQLHAERSPLATH